MNNIAVIPARSGSKRLPRKNYLPFNSRTLVEIARDKCLKAGIFDQICITSDDPYFKKFTDHRSVEFLLRPDSLANDHATTDKVVDFLFEERGTCTNLLWVNTVSPLQTLADIESCAQKLMEPDIDAVMAVNTLYQHCCVEGSPINFTVDVPFERTQDLIPIQRYVYSCMGWNRRVYTTARQSGFMGLFPGNIALVEVGPLAGMLIKTEADFSICERLEIADVEVKI